MASWQQVVAVTSTTGSILLGRIAPEYRFHDSTFQTGIIMWTVQAMLCLTYTILIYPLFFSPLLKLPSPRGHNPLMGQFLKIAKEPSGAPMEEWCETVPNNGLIHYRTVFNAPRVLLTNPKSLAEVLTVNSYDFIKPAQIREGLGRILGVGILLAEGDEHKRQRKNLTPAFTFRHVKELYPVFWTKAVEMVAAMNKAIAIPTAESEKPSNVIEVGEWASRAALDIIGVAGMGRDFNAIEDPSNELYQTYRKLFRPTNAARALGIMGLFFPGWFVQLLPIQRNDDMKQASTTVKRVAYDLIQTKKAKMEKGQNTDVDILSVALGSGGFTDDDLVNQLMTFLAAGHETTASTMNWAIMRLCQNPEIQKRLRKNLRDAGITSPLAPNATQQVTAADLDKVPYLAAVCNEVLRMDPPVGMTLRAAARDTTILGQFIPKGTTVIMSPLAINHNKELWGPDALEFNPDRWMGPGKANSGGASSNYAFMTFIHGPRGCIGSGFARAEFMCLLAAWVLAFETELEDPKKKIEVAGGVTSRPKGGLKVKLTPILS